MSELNLPPFYIGQKVVRITLSTIIMKGKTYTISDIMWCCDLWGWRVKLAEVIPPNAECECGRRHEFAFAAKNFVPAEEKFEVISFKKVIKQEKPLLSPN